MTQQVVLASGNKGKLRELNALLQPQGFEVLSQSAFNTEEADETGLTFVENALIKARNACLSSGLPAIADDSGLEVDYLNGAPGIYSARFSEDSAAGITATDPSNNEKLLSLLDGIGDSQRTARFHCCTVYMRHAEDPTPIICQANWEGLINKTAVGDAGFGYDPLFFDTEHNCTSAQLPREVKNRISHRAKAIALLVDKLQQ